MLTGLSREDVKIPNKVKYWKKSTICRKLAQSWLIFDQNTVIVPGSFVPL